MKKTKILVDARSIGGEGQGVVTYLRGLYNALHEKYGNNYEIYFAGYHPTAIINTFPFLEKRQIIKLKSQSTLKLLLVEFPKIIKQYGIQFAHFQYVVPFIKTCAYIVTSHDVLFLDFKNEFSWLYRMKRKWTFAYALRQSQICLTVSEYSKKKLVFHFGIEAKNISVTPNAVATKFFEPYDKKAKQQLLKNKYGITDYILYVSRIESRKNHSLLLQAFDELNLANKGKQLVLIGNNTLEEKDLEAQIERLKAKCPNQVHWLKNVDDEELLTFYQAATLFVYPSKGEGFGIPPIEAAALKINTLCAKNTAMLDFNFFTDNYFNAEQVEDLKSKLIGNLENPPCEATISWISKQIQKRYDWKRSATVLHKKIQNNSFKGTGKI